MIGSRNVELRAFERGSFYGTHRVRRDEPPPERLTQNGSGLHDGPRGESLLAHRVEDRLHVSGTHPVEAKLANHRHDVIVEQLRVAAMRARPNEVLLMREPPFQVLAYDDLLGEGVAATIELRELFTERLLGGLAGSEA